MAAPPKQTWRSDRPLTIGAIHVDPNANEIRLGGETLRLRPLLMDVLLRLAATPNEVVSREQLLADVWPRRMVNDEVLSRAVAELRTLLRDDAKQPRYIETLPKIGYRLIAAVSVASLGVALPVARSEPPLAASLPPTETSSAGTTPPVAAAASRFRHPWVILGAVAVIAFAGTAAFFFSRPRSSTSAPLGVDAATSAANVSLQVGRAESFSADADFELSPRFSGDGKRVVYAQGNDQQTRLVVREVGGAVLTTIAKAETLLLSPVFGPSGRSLIYLERSAARCGVVERELGSSQERTLIDCKREPRVGMDLSPDGAHLVVSLRHRADFPRGIARVGLHDGSIEMLTTPQPDDGEDLRPRFSPDGRRLVFSRGTSSHSRLWMLNLAEPAAAKPLLAVEGLDYGVAWLGNDGPLLVSADWSGARGLHVVDLKTSKIDAVGARGARYPDANLAGDIVYESANFRADLWLSDATQPGANARVLWPSTRYTNQPVFSPDGARLAFTSNREGAGALYVGELNGAVRKLTLSTDYRYIRPRWSRDGRSLFAVRSPVGARHAGPNEGVRIDLASGETEVLSALGQQVADVRELPDGSLLVAESTSKAMRLLRVVSGRAQRLPFPLVSEFQAQNDDVVFLQPNLTDLTSCQLSTQRCAPLGVTIAETDRYHWHLGNGTLWYRESSAGDQVALVKHDLATGKMQRFGFAPTGAGTSIAASADGRWLVVSREEPPVIDVMLARRKAP